MPREADSIRFSFTVEDIRFDCRSNDGSTLSSQAIFRLADAAEDGEGQPEVGHLHLPSAFPPSVCGGLPVLLLNVTSSTERPVLLIPHPIHKTITIEADGKYRVAAFVGSALVTLPRDDDVETGEGISAGNNLDKSSVATKRRQPVPLQRNEYQEHLFQGLLHLQSHFYQTDCSAMTTARRGDESQLQRRIGAMLLFGKEKFGLEGSRAASSMAVVQEEWSNLNEEEQREYMNRCVS